MKTLSYIAVVICCLGGQKSSYNLESFMDFFLKSEFSSYNRNVKYFYKTYNIYSENSGFKSVVKSSFGNFLESDTIMSVLTKEIIPKNTIFRLSKRINKKTILIIRPIFNKRDSTVISGFFLNGHLDINMYKFKKGGWEFSKTIYSQIP